MLTLSPLAAPGHTVQFYKSEAYLGRVVADFLAAAARGGHPLVVVARPQVRQMVSDELAGAGLDVAALRRAGELLLLDARELLDRFDVNGAIDPALFRRAIGSVLSRASRGRDLVVHAYGEMVNTLWVDGRHEDAVRVEELWNELAESHRFSLLCGYSLEHFDREDHADLLQRICRAHGHVAPTESFAELSEGIARDLEVTRLQQRERTLLAELARRDALEAALREALEQRERAESDRQQLLEGEQAARREAEQANRLKDEFLAVLSHELRTPLNVIVGWSQIMSGLPAHAPAVKRGVEVIQRNARHQLRLVEDLLDVSKVLSGKLRLNTVSINMVAVVSAAIEAIRPDATARRLSIDLQVSGGGATVLGDAERLQQVLWNLLSNAVKFTPSGGRIDVQVRTERERVQVAVRDTGEGISPEFLPHVFDRFRQAHTGTTRTHGGLGLGLAVVRYFVEAHGGTVAVATGGEGRGATFTVSLPAQTAYSSTGDPAARSIVEARAGALPKSRILVIDDDPDSRELFACVLDHAGAIPEMAASVEEALHLLSTRAFDLFIGDIGMPGQDGYALIRTIRRHPDPAISGLPGLAITSYAGESYRLRALEAGFTAYLSKPVSADALVATILQIL